jgi:hypothetical protein
VLDRLDAQQDLQAQKVEDSRMKMVELMEEFKIVDLGSGTRAWWTQDGPETGRKQLIMHSKMSTLQVEQEISTITTQIEKLKDLPLPPQELIELAVALQNVDGTVTALIPEYQKLRVQLQSFVHSGLGEKHPGVVAARSQLNELGELLQEGVLSVKESLKTRLEIAQRSLEDLEGMEDRQDESMDERKRYTQYMESKRNYETQNLILTNMKETLSKERIALTMPKDPITIHEVAEANGIPAIPRVSLQLALGAVIGLLAALPAGLLFAYLGHIVSSKA